MLYWHDPDDGLCSGPINLHRARGGVAWVSHVGSPDCVFEVPVHEIGVR